MALEDLLGARRRVRMCIELCELVLACGRAALAAALTSSLLDDVRICGTQCLCAGWPGPPAAMKHPRPLSAALPLLRIVCPYAPTTQCLHHQRVSAPVLRRHCRRGICVAQAELHAETAQTCGQWDVAHAQLRAMCLAAPSAPVQWALFNAVAGPSRRGYDERWLLRLLMREAQSPLIAVSVAHHCCSRSSRLPSPSTRACTSASQRAPHRALRGHRADATRHVARQQGQGPGASRLWLAAGVHRLSGRRQEAAYNTARAYHHLGLGHLAVGGYQSVLELSAKAR